MINAAISDLVKIYRACAHTLYTVLDNLPDEQLNWRPQPDSRSIGEIYRHLIRVDGHILHQFGHLPQTTDPGNQADASTILSSLKTMHGQVIQLLGQMEGDDDLVQTPIKPMTEGHDTIGEWIAHLSQHYLYHLAQVIYLRRAQDRSWKAPSDDWEKATFTLSDSLTCMAGIVRQRHSR